jgi:peroxiredoxin
MRKSLLFLVALAAFGSSLQAADQFDKRGAVTPRKAPEFVFKMPEGEKLLSSYRGKTIVLAMMFTTCQHCQNTAHLLTKFQSEYASKGVQVLGAVFDKDAKTGLANFKRITGATFPIGISEQGAVLEFLGLQPTDPYFVPILVFIDKNGILRSQYVNDDKFLDEAKQEANIRMEIDKTLAGQKAGAAKK